MPFLFGAKAFGILHYDGMPPLWYIFGVVAVSAVGFAPLFKKHH